MTADSNAAGEQVWGNPWLRAKLLTFRRKWTANKAAARGALIVFKELGDALPRYSEDTLDLAASNGHLNVIQWLHANRSEGCTKWAMDLAAGNGFLDVVQWLDANRREGCTRYAMNLAAKNGHLVMVQWLHANRREGCTTLAIDWAAKNGHGNVVEWLRENRTEGCTVHAIIWAASNRHFDLALWLHANITAMREPDVLSDAIHTANCDGHFTAASWLRSVLQNKRQRIVE